MLRREAEELIDPDDFSEMWNDLAGGVCERVLVGSSEEPTPSESVAGVIFPGAFDPLHAGHREMARIAQEMLDAPLAFEISLSNVDKPPLELAQVQQRLKQFIGERVWVTRAATFAEKADLFAGATFVVGIDTIARVTDPKYYLGSRTAMEESITSMERAGCRFLVFGRQVKSRFLTLSDLELPNSLLSLSLEVSPDLFRFDLSSTILRQQKRKHGAN